MADVYNAFQKIDIKAWDTKQGKRYFDPLRKIFLPITPEELVRQRAINFLREECGVPMDCMHSEEHLSHYGVDENGRMDIVITSFSGDKEIPLAVVECKKESVLIDADQVIEQAYNYSSLIDVKYFMLVNGCKMKCYKIEGGSAVPFANLLTYTDMLFEKNEVKEVIKPFERLEYDEYFDVDRIKSYPWAYSKIGEDTPDSLIPYIINIDDCLLDSSIRLTEIHNDDFSLVSDLGTQLRQYDDSSGGGFGTGVYRSFIVVDKRYHSNFLIGFSIIATAKTHNDPVYGNTDGKSVLVVMVNDGDTDEMSVQINLNRYMKVVDKNRVRITHNGAVTRKGASKKDLFDYISGYSEQLVDGGSVVTGELDCNVSLTMDNDDVKEFLSRLIEYSVYRNEYKKSLSSRKR